MIWCRTALKLGRIIRGTFWHRKSYLIFRVTGAYLSAFLPLSAAILGIW